MSHTPKLSPSSDGYAQIRSHLGVELHRRGASSGSTELYADLPDRFAASVRKLRDALELHAQITERQEGQVLHALRAARTAVATSEEAAAQALVVPNLAQDLATIDARLARHRETTASAVRSLSRWWTVIAVSQIVTMGTAGLLGLAVVYLLAH